MKREVPEKTEELATRFYILQEEFRKLSEDVKKLLHSKVEASKKFVRSYLKTDENFGCNKAIFELYIQSVDKMEKAEDLVQFLIDHNFSSYLNHQLLKKMSELADNGCDFAEYEKMRISLLKRVKFSSIDLLFRAYPDLVPGQAFGLPVLKYQLNQPSFFVSLYDWIDFLPHLLPSHIASIQNNGGSIAVTYSLFPSCSLIDVQCFFRESPESFKKFQDNEVLISWELSVNTNKGN